MNDLIATLDTVARIVEVCAGYRSRAEEAGFSPAVAEAMALQLHAEMVKPIGRPAKADK